MTTLGWILVAFPVVLALYAYFGYPALLWLIARKPRPRPGAVIEDWPLVSIVVPAYNEERHIAGKIEALLGQDYPANKKQILVLSDASSDRTDEIVKSFANRGVELMRMPKRGGKTAAENASCERLRGSLVLNSDATVRMSPGSVKQLVSAMADPTIGVASTRDVSVINIDSTANVTEAQYVGYEMWVRRLETLSGGIVGASGSGYIIRRELHDIQIPDMLSRDFSAALTAENHGYRAVSLEEAVVSVPRTTSLRGEYRRKVRTIARGMDTLIYQRHLLDPIQHGAFAWKLLSHKVCRWALPISAAGGMIGLLLLSPTLLLARLAVVAVALVALAVTGAWYWPADKPMPRLMSTLAFSALANVAVVHAVTRIVLGHDDHVWEPTRRTIATHELSATART